MGSCLGRGLDTVDLIALFVDAIEVASHAVVVELGITTDGTKVPLWLGSTEDGAVSTSLLQNLVDRGLKSKARSSAPKKRHEGRAFTPSSRQTR